MINLARAVISSVPESPEVLWREEKEGVGTTLAFSLLSSSPSLTATFPVYLLYVLKL